MPDLLVHPTDSTQLQETIQEIKKSRKQTKFPISSVYPQKDRVVIKCRNQSDVQETENIMENLNTIKVNTEIGSVKKPRIKVVGIDSKIETEDDINLENDTAVRNSL